MLLLIMYESLDDCGDTINNYRLILVKVSFCDIQIYKHILMLLLTMYECMDECEDAVITGHFLSKYFFVIFQVINIL